MIGEREDKNILPFESICGFFVNSWIYAFKILENILLRDKGNNLMLLKQLNLKTLVLDFQLKGKWKNGLSNMNLQLKIIL